MSFVIPHRVNDKPVANFYERRATQGDLTEITAEAPGRRALALWADGTYNTNTGAFEYELPFSYLMNQEQLVVMWDLTDRTSIPTSFKGWSTLLSLNIAAQSPFFDPAVDPHYVELAANRVALYNIQALTPAPFVGIYTPTGYTPGPGANNAFFFYVPHTALPGSIRNRVIVENQGDNVGIELLGPGDGIALKSPLGKTFLLRVNEAGMITSEELK